MDRTNDIFKTEDVGEIMAAQFADAACTIAEMTGMSAGKAAKRLAREIASIWDSVTVTLEKLKEALNRIFEQIEENAAVFDIEPRHRRRKRDRERARLIEQRYSVKIRCCERARPFRRVYKPP